MRTKTWTGRQSFEGSMYTEKEKGKALALYDKTKSVPTFHTIYSSEHIYNEFNRKFQQANKKSMQGKSKIPNEASLERFICGLVLEYNRESEERIHKILDITQKTTVKDLTFSRCNSIIAYIS